MMTLLNCLLRQSCGMQLTSVCHLHKKLGALIFLHMNAAQAIWTKACGWSTYSTRCLSWTAMILVVTGPAKKILRKLHNEIICFTAIYYKQKFKNITTPKKLNFMMVHWTFIFSLNKHSIHTYICVVSNVISVWRGWETRS